MIPKVANKKLTKCQEKSDEEFQKYPRLIYLMYFLIKNTYAINYPSPLLSLIEL